MNVAQRAVVAAAKKEGCSPCEIAAELLGHDLLEVMLDQMRKRQVAFTKLSEQEQDAVIAEMQAGLKTAVSLASRVINAQGVETVRAKLKALKIDGKLTATMIIEGDEPNRHVLTDKAHDKSDILIVLYPNSYSEGMSAFQGEKDQKELVLDQSNEAGGALAPKAARKNAATKASDLAPAKEVKLTPKLIADGRDFVTIQQNATLAGIQNHLKIGIDKAEALLKLYEGEGLVKFVGTDQNGHYELVRASAVNPEPLPVFDAATLEVMYSTACREVLNASSADDSVMRQVYGDDDNLMELALMRMEEDGIVSEPSKEGLRDVLKLPVDPVV